MIYRATLPLPPSANDIVRPAVIGWDAKRKPIVRLVKTTEAKEWLKVAQGKLHVAQLDDAVELFCEFFLPTIASDCNNRVKQLEDALKGFAWHDDKQVAESHTFKRIALTEAEQRVVVVVKPANPAEHAELVRRLETSHKRSIAKAVKQFDLLPASEPAPKADPVHFIGDSCPGGHQRLAGSQLANLRPPQNESATDRMRRMATPATYRGRR